jgi:hypothetical protein
MKTSSQESFLEEANTGYINALPYPLPRRTKQKTQETSVCAMAWLFVAGILTDSPALDTKLVCMGFVVDKVTLKRVLSEDFGPPVIIAPLVYTHILSICHQ